MDIINLQFDTVLSLKTQISQKAINLLNNSKQYKDAGLIRAGQKLELEAAFDVCNALSIPIYQQKTESKYNGTYSGKWLKEHGYNKKLKETDRYECYNELLYCYEFVSIAEYQQQVPANIIEILQKVNNKHYPFLHIATLSSNHNHPTLVKMYSIDESVLQLGEKVIKDADPILLYKFDYGEYYMELARWD